jgi:ABC-type phosphate transport system substrate-binding protein
MIIGSQRYGALALSTVFVFAACSSGGGATSSPPGSAPASPATSGSAAPSGGTGGATPKCLSFNDLYALTGPESTGFTTWDAAQPLASKLGSKTAFPAGMPLTITAPGEESGTYDSFVEIVLTPIATAEKLPTDQTKQARVDYTASPDDNAIIQGVANSEGSLGWVGFAYYEENLDKVRAFEIDKKGDGSCVAPTAASIADNSYPISRSLYIYVNKAKAASNPAVVAYVDFYLKDGTIDKVLEKVPYVALKPDVLKQTQAAWAAARPANAAPNGKIFVSGSSTVQPVSQAVAEAFKATNSGFDFTVEGPGTGDGFKKFCRGETDISDASRKIKDEEAASCKAANIEYTELKIAIDGIAVMTQK